MLSYRWLVTYAQVIWAFPAGAIFPAPFAHSKVPRGGIVPWPAVVQAAAVIFDEVLAIAVAAAVVVIVIIVIGAAIVAVAIVG